MAEKECSSSGCTKESCEGCPSKKKESFLVEQNLYSDIKHVIGIASGKGGVGKSMATATLANHAGSKRLQGWNSGRRYYRPIHPENVRPARTGTGR